MEPSGSTVSTACLLYTSVQLIPRLYDAETGTVKVGGVDVKDYNLDVLRHEVSMVLQKNVLFSGTILDFALPVPPMMPSVSPGLTENVISFSTGWPEPCLYLSLIHI